MFLRKRLACSFCGKSASQVSKLVAGRRGYICDSCVAEASRVISDSGSGELKQPASPTRLSWIGAQLARLRRWRHGRTFDPMCTA